MSWNISYDSLADFDNDNGNGTDFGDSSAEVQQQKQQARMVAEEIITSDAVGRHEGENKVNFRVSLSGHANPGHVAKIGFANDTITVTVSQK